MPSEPLPWLELGNVIVYERIPAEGGMGQVYRGHHPILGQVAVKLIHERHRNGPSFAIYRARFRMEAEALGEIQGPHVVRLLDFGETAKFGDDHGPYIVMEYLEGHTLDSRRQETGGTVEPAQALKIAAQIAEALSLIHSKGYVYCDLNPRNIYLIARGNDYHFVKLLDLGLAHLASGAMPPPEAPASATSVTFSDTELNARRSPDGDRSRTLPSPTADEALPPSTSEPRYHPTSGAPGHMAPEQLRGERATFLTDVHAVGRILFEMLTGRNWMDEVRSSAVRKDRSLNRNDQRVCEDYLSPSRIRRLIAPALRRHVVSRRLRRSLVRILSTCLSDDLASRSQEAPEASMDALSHDLRSYAPLAGEGARSRLPYVAALVAALLVSGVVIGFVSIPRPVRLHVEGSETLGGYIIPEMIPHFLQSEGATSWRRESTTQPESNTFQVDLPSRGRVVLDVIATGSLHPSQRETAIRMEAAEVSLPREYKSYPIGFDALVPIVAKSNPTRGITQDELRRIFTGEVTNWSQIKGPTHTGEILVHIPEERHGTHAAFAKMLGLTEIKGTTHVVLDEMSRLVAKNPNAIGFIGLALVGDAKPLCVAVGNGTVYVSPIDPGYPFRRRLFLYVNTSAPQAELATKLASYVQSDPGQELLAKRGYFDNQGQTDTVVRCPMEDRR